MKKNQNLIKDALEILKQSELKPYKIAQDTGIHETTISNYRNGKTTPTHANAKLLLYYFDELNNRAANAINQQIGNIQQGKNISYYQEISPETIAKNSRNYQEIIKQQQETIEKLLALIEKLTK